MTDILIIGAGVMGLMTARELLKAGASVRLLDRQAVGRESSWAGGGILSPLCPWRTPEPIIRLWLWSQTEFPRLAETLERDTGIDPEWRRSGLLVGDCEDTVLVQNWCRDHGVPFEPLTAAGFGALEPGLRLSPRNPVLFPAIAQVRNPRLIRALRADVLRRGAEILEHRAVTGLTIAAGRVAGVRTDQGDYSAGCCVLTTGAWTGLLSREWLGLPDLPVEPVKGQMLAFAARPDLLSHIVLNGGRYLIPRQDGLILAGSTLEYTGFDKATSQAARAELETFALELLPELAGFPIETHWAGLRPGSPSGIPYIGPHPEIGGLFFNCGHFRNGFVMAPASARLLADLLLDRPSILPAEAYALEAEH
jgi:glycine oxidase